ncbi:hypothetical protein [Mycolicibacterium sp. 120270]|uniref:hypothetical protein n=1 Tax=Mycolicibacterium sp. 120270 TaxID=3090600 RepID=UPI00299CE201|nr:hypothetical protein [Mycolicibacterium sp. 120270]MDX1884175.1 hypothetical protein [Mycolicibacterium sp. 120270]
MTRQPFVHKYHMLGVAVALSVAASLMAPAHADRMLPLAPPCATYVYPEGFAIQQADGWRVDFKGNGPFPDGDATATKGGQTMYGVASGGIEGRHVDFTVQWSTGPVGQYTGDIDESGIAHGTGFDEAHPTSSSTWNSLTAFECVGAKEVRPTLSGRYRVDIDDAFELEGHPFRSNQIWDITSTCSSEDVCTAQVIPDHHKWTGTAHFSIPTGVSSVGNWSMTVDLPAAVTCTDESGTHRIPGTSDYYWGPFMTGNDVPTQSTDGGLNWSHGAGCGKPAEKKGAVLTMTKIS